MFPTYLSGGEPSALGAEALADTDRAADRAAEVEEDEEYEDPLGGSESSIEIEVGERSEITVMMVSAAPTLRSYGFGERRRRQRRGSG